MSTPARWSALIIGVLLAGCTALHPRVERAAKKLECDGSKDCTVVVTVSCLRYFECELAVDYDLVLVLTRNKPVDIHWKLEGEKGAEFAANGVVIENSVFDCKREGRDRYACTDKHPATTDMWFAHSHVTVKDSAFGPRGVQSLDPWVVNY